MKFKQFIFGGDYNPEQWPEEIWLEDAQLMKEAGVNLVSLGIFSWAKLEPQPGQFEFAWLDKLMDLLYAHGVSVNLATPTASPPPWMVKLHPDILPVTSDGVTLWHGARRHYCPHSINYHNYAKRIATVLAERYCSHPALAMWHVDNEYACHFGECYCNNSAIAFRHWLKSRYGSLDGLNDAWGTTFWGQIYGDWEEIEPPRHAPTFCNPTQQLDWARFSSDSWLSCFQEQKEILKAATPDVPVTTNFISFNKSVDYFKFASHEDVVSNDCYPDTSQPDWMVESGMICDMIRSVGNGKPWILMEQAASLVNWRQRNASKRPGIMRIGSMQSVARGANGIMFFQWRQSKIGAEKHHSGMLPHAGTNTRTWHEVKSLGNELPRLNALLSSEVSSQVAILMDWNNWWALELDSKPSNDLKLLQKIVSFYRILFEQNITVDFVHPQSDLSGYKLVVMPNLYLVTDEAVKNINDYVQQGGTLLMTYFSGIVDANEHVRLGGYPAPFREMLGMVVEEFAPYQPDERNSIVTLDGNHFENSFWADVIHLEGAEALARYSNDYYEGVPAVTRNHFGHGNTIYLGTELEAAGIRWLLNEVCQLSGVRPSLVGVAKGVEVIRRSDGNKTWLFLLNHTGAKVDVSLDRSGVDLLSGLRIENRIQLEINGVAVVEQEHE